MENILKLFLKAYKLTISKLIVLVFGKGCIFTPTCSVYAHDCIKKRGVIIGACKALVRVIKCNPYYRGNLYDPAK